MDDTKTQPEPIESNDTIEADIEVSQNVNSDSKLERIMSLENMINGYILDLDKLQKDLKEQSSMLKDTFENDADFAAASEKVSDMQKIKKEVQDKLLQDPAISLLDAKVSDLKTEVKDVRQALSDYLQQYYRESGLTQITGADGEVREIVATARLVKKKD
ncbi:hypothetical protein KBD81_00695 [Candidatus Woesebacteria bacterium]|nr:hypothetical protein [Candidatus Woesebacteria bacterium]